MNIDEKEVYGDNQKEVQKNKLPYTPPLLLSTVDVSETAGGPPPELNEAEGGLFS